MRAAAQILLLLLCTACAPPPNPSGEPHVLSGVLPGETVLQGRVEMAGDVLVPAGSILTLLPGTTVYIRPAESTKIDPEYLSPATELLVRGTLRVAGTAENPVRFLPLGAPEETPWWAGIVLDGAVGSRIEGAEIAGAEAGILCLRSSPYLGGNRLRDCRYGIIAQQDSAPEIVGNRIDGGEGGIFCWRGSRPHLQDNEIRGQMEEGLFVDAESRPRLGRNVFAGCAVALALSPRDLDLGNLQLTDNGQNVLWLGAAPEAP